MTIRWAAVAVLAALAAPADAGTRGRVLAEQLEDATMDRRAASVRFDLTQGLAYATEFVGDPYYQVALFPADVDLSGAKSATDIADWVESTIRDRKLRAVVVTIEPDGDAQNMKVHADGQVELGASGTMGTVYGLAREGQRLRGHYVHFGDVFGNPVVIDASFDEPLWQAAKGTPLAAGGGAPGKAYLTLLDAGRKGDRETFVRHSVEGGTEAEWKEMLPMLQAFLPDEAKVVGGEAFPGRAVLEVRGTRDGEPYAATVVMVERDGWRMESSSSGSATGRVEPPAIAGAEPDLVPALAGVGLVAAAFPVLEAPFAPKHGFAVRRAGNDEYDPQILVALSETELDAAHANALWRDDVPFERMFRGKGERRALVLLYNEVDGAIQPSKRFVLTEAGELVDESTLQGGVLRFGDRLVGQYLAQHYDEAASDNVTDGGVRFELPIVAATE